MTDVSFPEVSILKNSSTLAVSVTINLFTKLGFVSVHDPKETYFVDALRILMGFYKPCLVNVKIVVM